MFCFVGGIPHLARLFFFKNAFQHSFLSASALRNYLFSFFLCTKDMCVFLVKFVSIHESFFSLHTRSVLFRCAVPLGHVAVNEKDIVTTRSN